MLILLPGKNLIPSGSPAFDDPPACADICSKAGVNTAYPVRQQMSEYERARYLGMGWILEIAYHPVDLGRTVEAINRAHDHGLEFVLRICAGSECAFSDPTVYADFLRDVARQVDGEFWALMGPNEPDLEKWAGGAEDVAAYMNAVMGQVEDIPNLRMVSPAFNLTNSATHNYFRRMELAGARFADLDAFAGTSYTVAGNGAYYYYRYNIDHDEKMRHKVQRFDKPFIFAEYGTFGMFDKPNEGDPRRALIVQELKTEFSKAANDETVMAVLYFDAFGINGSAHRLYDPELIEITRDTDCTPSAHFTTGYNQAGVGVSTDQTLWQLEDEVHCREFAYGCPFNDGVVCPPGSCIDNDGDGFLGDGGDGACTRDDCDDGDAARGLSCGGGGSPVPAEWGTVRMVEDRVSTSDVAVWPILKIRENGLPVIAYHNGVIGRGDLNLLDCTAPDCSTALRRVLSVENLVGTFLSMQIRHSGHPIIAHLDQTDDDFEVYDCFDSGCAHGQNRIIDYETGHYGFDTSMAIRPSGRPLIAYWHSSFQDLNVYDCSNQACTTGSIRTLESENQVGLDPSIIIGDNLNPLIAYARSDNPQLRLWICADEDCVGGDRIKLDTDDAEGFPTHAMALRSSGLPVIVYRKTYASDVMLYDCTAPDCSTGTSRLLYSGVDVQSASIGLLADDSPFIAFSEYIDGNYDLVMVRCLDPSCAATAMTTYTDGNAGSLPDVAIRADGNPLVVFHDVGNGALVLYEVDLDLVPGGHPEPVPTRPPWPTWTPTPTGTPTETPTPTPTFTPTPAPYPVDVVVNDVQARIIGEDPAQIEITVSGYHPDGCKGRARIEQARDGDTVMVKIYRLIGADQACPAMTRPYQATILLDGTFEAGPIYTINVNGYLLEVSLPTGPDVAPADAPTSTPTAEAAAPTEESAVP